MFYLGGRQLEDEIFGKPFLIALDLLAQGNRFYAVQLRQIADAAGIAARFSTAAP